MPETDDVYEIEDALCYHDFDTYSRIVHNDDTVHIDLAICVDHAFFGGPLGRGVGWLQ
jgi:hypothetical protein